MAVVDALQRLRKAGRVGTQYITVNETESITLYYRLNEYVNSELCFL
jgi:hypothetical protein